MLAQSHQLRHNQFFLFLMLSFGQHSKQNLRRNCVLVVTGRTGAESVNLISGIETSRDDYTVGESMGESMCETRVTHLLSHVFRSAQVSGQSADDAASPVLRLGSEFQA